MSFLQEPNSGGPVGWALGGNSGLSIAQNKIGTTDTQTVGIIVNSQQQVHFDAAQLVLDNCLAIAKSQSAANVAGANVTFKSGDAGPGLNINGGNLTLNPGFATGSGLPGTLQMALPTVGTSGTTLNTSSTNVLVFANSSYPSGEVLFQGTAQAGLEANGPLNVATNNAAALTIGDANTGSVTVSSGTNQNATFSGTGTGSTFIGSNGSALTCRPTGNSSATFTANGTGVTNIGNGGAAINITPSTNNSAVTISPTGSGVLTLGNAGSGGVNVATGNTGTLTCRPSTNGSAIFSANGTGTTSLGISGAGPISIGAASKIITLNGIYNRPNKAEAIVKSTNFTQTINQGGNDAFIPGAGDVVLLGGMAYGSGTGIFTLPRAGSYLVTCTVPFSVTNSDATAGAAGIVGFIASGTAIGTGIGLTQITVARALALGGAFANAAQGGLFSFSLYLTASAASQTFALRTQVPGNITTTLTATVNVPLYMSIYELL